MSSVRHFISKTPGSTYPPEKGRYHYYMALACPFVGRSLAALYLNNLDDYFTYSIAHPVKQRTRPDDPEDKHEGWFFLDPSEGKTVTINGREYPTDGCIPDTVHNMKFVRDIYESVDDEKHPYTVPMIFDKKTNTIVNSESADQVRMFSKAFKGLTDSQVDLVPDDIEKNIDEMNDGLIEKLNYNLYLAAFMGGPPEELYKHMDTLEDILAKNKYILGDRLTETDIRLYHTLIRYDAMMTDNMKKLTEFPNVTGYIQELYQIPAFRKTTNWAHLKMFNQGHPNKNGPYVDYDAPSKRK